MPKRLRVGLILTALAAVVAAVGARPYAGGWNDASRLAAAEGLVDHGGWSIDDSIFVNPALTPPGAPLPFASSNRLLLERGTLDRLLIDGRFVSDKTPVSSLLLAGQYWSLQHAAGLVMRDDARHTIYWLTLLSAGTSFVAAVGFMFVLASRLSDSAWLASGLTLSFAFATCAAAYSRHVNAHVIALAACAAVMCLVDTIARNGCTPRRGFGLGTLAGAVYGFDAGLGPIVAIVAGVFIGARSRTSLWPYLAGLVPWMALQHGLNWHIGQTLAPLGSVPAYLTWPGSPFDRDSMSGRYTHDTVGDAVSYSLDLIAGRRGFLLHNLPLLMLPVASWRLVQLRRRLPEWPAVAFALSVSAATWMIYALGSSNRSGEALSIRWFLPLLAPLFYVVFVDLRIVPSDRRLFAALSAVGALMSAAAWTTGPWQPRVPFFWVWVSLALAVCGVWARQAVKARREGTKE